MSTLIVQLDMEEFCEVADLSAAYVIEIVEHGILEPQGGRPGVAIQRSGIVIGQARGEVAPRAGPGVGRRGPGAGPARRSAATALRKPDAQATPGPPAGGLTGPGRICRMLSPLLSASEAATQDAVLVDSAQVRALRTVPILVNPPYAGAAPDSG